MQNQPQLPGHVNFDQYNQMLVAPESFAARPESLTEQLLWIVPLQRIDFG